MSYMYVVISLMFQYSPVGGVTIGEPDMSATPTESDAISDDVTPTPTHSRMQSSGMCCAVPASWYCGVLSSVGGKFYVHVL